jgi:hypothetical protein
MLTGCLLAPLVPSMRLTLALIGFLGFVVVYACRVNLSVALVCMVNQTAIGNPSSSNATLGERRLSDVRPYCLHLQLRICSSGRYIGVVEKCARHHTWLVLLWIHCYTGNKFVYNFISCKYRLPVDGSLNVLVQNVYLV